REAQLEGDAARWSSSCGRGDRSHRHVARCAPTLRRPPSRHVSPFTCDTIDQADQERLAHRPLLDGEWPHGKFGRGAGWREADAMRSRVVTTDPPGGLKPRGCSGDPSAGVIFSSLRRERLAGGAPADTDVDASARRARRENKTLAQAERTPSKVRSCCSPWE